MAEEKGSKTYFHLDFTVLIVIGVVVALGIGGYMFKRAADRERQREIIDAENAKKERELRQKEMDEKAEEQARLRRQQEVVEKKETQERLDASAELRAQERKEQQKKEDERKARWEERQKKEAEAAQRNYLEREAEAKRIIEERQAAEKAAQAAARAASLAPLQEQYNTATKEIEQLQNKIGASKVIAAKNKMEGAQKKIVELQKKHAEYSSSPTGAVEAARIQAQIEAAQKEQTDAAAALELAKTGEVALRDAMQRRDTAAAQLKAMGVEANPRPVAAATATPKPVTKPAEPAAQQGLKIFVLKDGKKIGALKAIDGGDVWSIKTEDGKFLTIEKSAVEKILED